MAIFKIIQENPRVFNGDTFSRHIRTEYQYSKAQMEAMLPKMVHRFRCKDADGVTYFWGVCSDPSSFAPLDCVGAEYGCTAIEYKDPTTGKYKQL